MHALHARYTQSRLDHGRIAAPTASERNEETKRLSRLPLCTTRARDSCTALQRHTDTARHRLRFPLVSRRSCPACSLHFNVAMSANDDQAARDARKLVPVATQSSAGSDVSSAPSSPSRKSAGSSFKLSSLHHALSRPAHSSSAHKRHHPHYDDPDYTLPSIRDPIHLCETAISLMLSVPGPTVDQLRQRFIPQLYHVSAYQHRVNTREVGMEELLKVMDRYRQRFSVRRAFRYVDLLSDCTG